jgi:hypothetical protein
MEIEEHSAIIFNTLTETSSASLNLSEGNISTNSDAPESPCEECHRKSKQINHLSNLVKKQKQSVRQLRMNALPKTCKQQQYFKHEFLTNFIQVYLPEKHLIACMMYCYQRLKN